MITDSKQIAWEGVERMLRPFVATRVPPADVDDVLQEIFLRMSRGLHDLRDDERFGPWMYQVARSAVADHWRAAYRRPPVQAESSEAAIEEIAAPVPDSDDAASRLTACVASFVALLPSPYREAITLTEIEGLTQREAAAMAGSSLTAMKSRVQRGRRQLREMLEACCRITLDARSRVIDYEPRPRCGCTPEDASPCKDPDHR